MASRFYTLLACLAVAFLLSAVFQARADGGQCSATSDCLSGTAAKDLAGASVDSRANCTSGLCTGCGPNTGSHCQCREASGAACNATVGTACTLQWNISNPNAPPTINPAGVCIDCPKSCSNNGVCSRNLTCICRAGWTGADCGTQFDLSTILNTGVSVNGTILPDGAKDPHWNVTGPNINSAQNASVATPASFWDFNSTPPSSGNSTQPSGGLKSKWITPFFNNTALNNSTSASNTTAGNLAAGFYNYTNTFSLTGFYPNLTSIGLSVAADDQVQRVLLNGVDLLLPETPQKPYSFSHIFELFGWRTNGTNTLSIQVLNLAPGPSPTGLRVEAEVVTRTSICDTDSECLGITRGAVDATGKAIEGGFCVTNNNSTSTSQGKVCQCVSQGNNMSPTGAIGSHCQCLPDPRCGTQYAVFSYVTGNFLGCANRNSTACL